MKFFGRKKDKRKNEAGEMPGFGSSFDGNNTNGKGNHRSTFPGNGRRSKGHNGFNRGGGSGDDYDGGYGRSGGGSSPPYFEGSYYGGDDARKAAASGAVAFRPMATRASAMMLANFPATVLDRIFSFVCPHSNDQSYETCEQSATEDACMLCDLRDLAHCAAVSRKWRAEAVKLLYHSIRIDTVHYCDREIFLSERRKRRSFFDRNGEPEDTAQARLKLLSRTLREDPVRLGRLVQFFKTPYMLRESCQADLARTIAVTPNLRYIDLPEGMFMDDPAYLTLGLEVQARCRELRKMTYMGGAERSLQALATGNGGQFVWTKLEVLELIRTKVDSGILRLVLGRLGNLRALKISEADGIDDNVFVDNAMLPPFPALEELILTDTPGITDWGLRTWLMSMSAEMGKKLRVLTLNTTGVKVGPSLQELVAHLLTGLKHLSIKQSVAVAIPADAVAPLASNSLETLHFEITAAPGSPKFNLGAATSSYYSYLANSLLSGGLPNMRAVYVRDPGFPDLLLFGLPPPPIPGFSDSRRPASSGSSASGFSSSQFSNASLLSPQHNQGWPSPMGSPSYPPPSQPSQTFGHRQQGSLPSLSPPWQPGHNPRFSSNNPFAAAALQQTAGGGGGLGGVMNLPPRLEVFTKGDDELDWSFVKVNPGGVLPTARGGDSGNGRPLSSYGLGADVMGGSAAGWSSGAGARRSVFVSGAAAGVRGSGFLAVPTEQMGNIGGNKGRGLTGGNNKSDGEDLWPRPISSAGERKREKLDLWR